MGLCQYVDLCFHASSLPCWHTLWHVIPTSFYIFEVFLPSLHLFICLSCSYYCNISFLLTWQRERLFDSSMFQSIFIHCCIIPTYACTYYSTILDSCHINFFVDMEVHEDFLMNPTSTGTHLIFRFMCDRK